MMIKINNKEFSKVELLKLINKNKIQAIIYLRGLLNTGLKEAKEIIENLEKHPDYYDNEIVVKENTAFKNNESIIIEVNDNKDVYVIDGEYLPKKQLLRLVKQSKLKSVKFLKDVVAVSLKDAKEIIDNLAENPNHYKIIL